jgi:hypothetical protein
MLMIMRLRRLALTSRSEPDWHDCSIHLLACSRFDTVLLEPRYGLGVAAGEVATEGDALGAGDGDGGCTSAPCNALKSELLITNVPSSSSVRAMDVPSGEDLPTVNLCCALSSGELVKVATSWGLSKLPPGTFATQRTACREASVFTSDCTFTVLIGPLPLTHCH